MQVPRPSANVALPAMAFPCLGLPQALSEAQDERSAQHHGPDPDEEPAFTRSCLQLQAGVSAGVPSP